MNTALTLIVCITCGLYLGIALGIFINCIKYYFEFKKEMKESENDNERTSR